jgi:hypothetical protein
MGKWEEMEEFLETEIPTEKLARRHLVKNSYENLLHHYYMLFLMSASMEKIDETENVTSI